MYQAAGDQLIFKVDVLGAWEMCECKNLSDFHKVQTVTLWHLDQSFARKAGPVLCLGMQRLEPTKKWSSAGDLVTSDKVLDSWTSFMLMRSEGEHIWFDPTKDLPQQWVQSIRSASKFPTSQTDRAAVGWMCWTNWTEPWGRSSKVKIWQMDLT